MIITVLIMEFVIVGIQAGKGVSVTLAILALFVKSNLKIIKVYSSSQKLQSIVWITILLIIMKVINIQMVTWNLLS